MTREQAVAELVDGDAELRRRAAAGSFREASPRLAPGDFLKERRRAAGVTLAKVAARGGPPPQTLSDIENGAQPTWATFSRSCSELGVTAAELEAEGLW